MFLIFFLLTLCSSSLLVDIERERIDNLKKQNNGNEISIYYDPNYMPLSVLKNFTECTLVTAEERQNELANVWETEMKRLVNNWKEREKELQQSRWIRVVGDYTHIYDRTKRFRYLTQIAEKKNLTRYYLKTVLSNLLEQEFTVPVPLFDVDHILKC